MENCVFKVILLGNNEVGKTTLFRKLELSKCPSPAGTMTRSKSKGLVDSIDLGPCMLEFQLTESVTVKVCRILAPACNL